MAVGLANSPLLLRLDVAFRCFFAHSHQLFLKSSKRAILEMTFFPILTFTPISYSTSLLCWPKSVPPQTYHLPPPPPPPRKQRSIMMEVVTTFFRLPIISYQAYMRMPKSVRPPRLLLLVLLVLLVTLILLLCILLVVLVLLTVVTTGITFLLLILLPPGTLTTVFLPIRMSVTQFLAEMTRCYLPSPIQTLFSLLSSLQRSLFNREKPPVAQKSPDVSPVPCAVSASSIIVTPTCLLDLPPSSPTSVKHRTLRRSKSWLRW